MHLETGPPPIDPPSIEPGGDSGSNPRLSSPGDTNSAPPQHPIGVAALSTPAAPSFSPDRAPVYWPQTQLRLFAGLQAGVIGGLAMLCFFSFASILQRQPWWSFENLLGSAIYGNAAFWKGLSRVTLAGAGLQIVLSGIAGMMCAFVLPPFRGYGLVQFLVALATATLWYVFQYQLLFPWIAPLVPAYAIRNLPVVGHLLLGISLSRIPALYEEQVRHYLSRTSVLSTSGTHHQK